MRRWSTWLNLGTLFFVYGLLSFFLGWMSWFVSVVVAVVGVVFMSLVAVEAWREEQR